MGNIERYTLTGTPEKPTFRVNSSHNLKQILDDLLSPSNLPTSEIHPLIEARGALIDSWARLGVLLERGGVISLDGKIAIPLNSQMKAWPKIPNPSVRIEPSFKDRLRYEMRVVLGYHTKPFFYLQGEGERKILVHRERGAMINLVTATYEMLQTPYPRVNSTSAVDQFLMSVVNSKLLR